MSVDRVAVEAPEHGNAAYECAAARALVLADRQLSAGLIPPLRLSPPGRDRWHFAVLASPPPCLALYRAGGVWPGLVAMRRTQEIRRHRARATEPRRQYDNERSFADAAAARCQAVTSTVQ
jgi:hypothetical protein